MLLSISILLIFSGKKENMKKLKSNLNRRKDSTAPMIYANLGISRNAWKRGNSLCQMDHLILSISGNT